MYRHIRHWIRILPILHSPNFEIIPFIGLRFRHWLLQLSKNLAFPFFKILINKELAHYYFKFVKRLLHNKII